MDFGPGAKSAPGSGARAEAAVRGRLGFGYDSMFQPDGFNITYGEFEPSAKHAINHRANAFDQLVAACFAP